MTDDAYALGYCVAQDYVYYRSVVVEPVPSTMYLYDLTAKKEKKLADRVIDFRVIGNAVYIASFETVTGSDGNNTYGDLRVLRCSLNGTGLKEVCRVGSDNAFGIDTLSMTMMKCRFTGSYMVMTLVGDFEDAVYYKVDYSTGKMTKSTKTVWNNLGTNYPVTDY